MMTTSPGGSVMDRAITARARRLETAFAPLYRDVDRSLLDLTRSQAPAIPVSVREAAKAALERGETHYTDRPGVIELRAAIAARETRAGIAATAENVIVTNGGSEALFIAVQTLVAAGASVAIVGGATPQTREMIRFVGATAVDGDEAASSDAVLISSPSPISGVALPPDEIARLVTAAVDTGKTVILDRSLEAARYAPVERPLGPTSAAENLVSIGSFSAGFGLTGWRVGWLTASADKLKRLSSMKQAMSICTTAVSQFAALAALEIAEAFLTERRATMSARLASVTAHLDSAAIAWVVPDAWPHLLIACGGSDVDVTSRLRAKEIVVTAGSSLDASATGHIRIAVDAPERTFDAGLHQVIRTIKEHAA